MSGPRYHLFDEVAVQMDEGHASRDARGVIVEITVTVTDNGAARTYVVEVPRLYADEEPEYLTVREDEICGLVEVMRTEAAT